MSQCAQLGLDSRRGALATVAQMGLSAGELLDLEGVGRSVPVTLYSHYREGMLQHEHLF